MNPRPLCVDCDGTLLRTDLLHEAVFGLIKRSLFSILLVPVWLLRGKAYLKEQLADRVSLDPALLPYNEHLLDYLRAAKRAGRELVLATAAPRAYAEAVAGHLKLFDRVEATEGAHNLAAKDKAQRLSALYGERGFEYAGNSADDLEVWKRSAGAVLVGASSSIAARVERLVPVVARFDGAAPRLSDYLQAARVHQWLKNTLVFVPLLAAHRWSDLGLLGQALLAFICYGLCASSAYLLNDLLDLPSDRAHPRKRKRPFASGSIPLRQGALLVPGLLALAGGLAFFLPPLFVVLLGGYYVTSVAYSLWLKSKVVIDVLTLGVLYTVRIMAGGAATSIAPSFWLLAFAMFLFLSLAMVKRYSELLVILREDGRVAAGRGYRVNDLPVLMSLGASSGYLAVLVMALYVNNPDVNQLYATPTLLWCIVPLLLFWVSRIWMKAHRGEMHDDPVVFALRDRTSLGVAVIVGVVLLAAMVRWNIRPM